MGLTRITSDGITDGTITGTDLATNVDLVDDQKLRFGTGNDLQIYHDGTDSYIKDAGTGRLLLLSNQFQVNSADNSEIQISAIENGAVNLYHNGVKKFETTANGVLTTGNIQLDSDSGKLTVGDSGDFEIYHNGSHTYLDNLTGHLIIRNNVGNDENTNIYIKAKQDEDGIVINDDAGVELYCDNSKKFETTSTGVDVTGNLTATGTSATLKVSESGGATGEIRAGGATVYVGTESNHNVSFISNNTIRMVLTNSGNLNPNVDSTYNLGSNSYRWANVYADTLYGDGSNLTGISSDLVNDTSPQLGGDLDVNGKKIKFPDLTGSVNNILYFGTGDDLLIYHHADVNYIQCENARTLRIQHFSGGNETLANFIPNGAVELYYNNSKKFETRDAGATLTGDLYMGDDNKLRLGNLTGGDLKIYHDGSNSYLTNKTGYLYIQADNISLAGQSAGENYLVANLNGSVQLYYDSSKKFETTSSGASITGDLGIGLSAAAAGYSRNAQIHGSGNGAALKLTDVNTGTGNGDGFDLIAYDVHGYVFLRESGNLYFATSGTTRAYFTSSGHFLPNVNNTYDLGSTSNRWRNVYTNDIHLSNEGFENDVDGTWGSYTIQEGAEDLFLINKRNGKKYKFNLTEVK